MLRFHFSSRCNKSVFEPNMFYRLSSLCTYITTISVQTKSKTFQTLKYYQRESFRETNRPSKPIHFNDLSCPSVSWRWMTGMVHSWSCFYWSSYYQPAKCPIKFTVNLSKLLLAKSRDSFKWAVLSLEFARSRLFRSLPELYCPSSVFYARLPRASRGLYFLLSSQHSFCLQLWWHS